MYSLGQNLVSVLLDSQRKGIGFLTKICIRVSMPILLFLSFDSQREKPGQCDVTPGRIPISYCMYDFNQVAHNLLY